MSRALPARVVPTIFLRSEARNTPAAKLKPMALMVGSLVNMKATKMENMIIAAAVTTRAGKAARAAGVLRPYGTRQQERQGHLLATAFHPELTPDRRIHELFVDIVKDNT